MSTPEIERVVKEFYQHMLKSTPVLDSFERASLKLKVIELLTTHDAELREKIEEMKYNGKNGVIFIGPNPVEGVEIHNKALSDVQELLTQKK